MVSNKVHRGQRGKRPERLNKSNHSMNIDRPKSEGHGGHNMRDRSTIKRLQMYRNYKPKRDSAGKILRPAPFQTWLKSGTVARVEPNRRWFGNTRVITQNALQRFQEEMEKVKKDPYKMIMKQSKLPVSLLNEAAKYARPHLLDTESYGVTFGKKAQRKRPKIKVDNLEDLSKLVQESEEKYNPQNDMDLVVEYDGVRDEAIEMVFKAGQSKRIWNELYKQKWVTILSEDQPTMAFHASLTNAFGKGAFINLLRQFAKLHSNKKQISVGFIGYPNVGKSSVINTLRKKKVCKVAPIAGETKVWQYITLMRRIYLVDCPGVVYPSGSTPTEIVLKGVVRVEHLRNPEDYIGAVLERVRPEYITRAYKIESWNGTEDFLEKLAKRYGKLLKGGDPDFNNISKIVLNDWQRGRLPYFVKPPVREGDETESVVDKVVVETPSKETAIMDEETVKTIPQVQQDLSKIQVQPEFVGDDVKSVNLDVSRDDSDVEDVSDKESDENDDETKEIAIPNVEKESADAKAFVELMTKSNEAEQTAAAAGEKDKGTDDSSDKSISKEESNVTETAAQENTSAKDEDKSEEIIDDNSKDETEEKSLTASLESIPSGSGISAVTEDSDDEADFMYKMKDPESKPSTSVTKECSSKVNIAKSNKNKKRKKKRHEESSDEDEAPKLTGKQRRKLDRKERTKKIGKHFYEYANVKNRSDRARR
ncbi:nucleolar GTP-binding protein 2 [Octopus bimaculoides]|uniref:Nucleolar GTP-binding protein 2 n=1 Tax=Octopus bimaculoides TaxID=37653 RepID=A0A0L8H4H7_OCTBM|nr:nucleolar GTP-binding protein 2 [Octopus bimaculoides]|eukprot:XP_014775789.1 PREDICTED: nucleolar GTP-binding protein 2-like [Octopus bimaculoides]